MERQNVPIPAESLRQLCEIAESEVEHLQSIGCPNSAEQSERFIEYALDLAEGKDGEYVSISGRKLSTLAADAGGTEPSACARTYLEQYNVWESPDDCDWKEAIEDL